MGSSRPVGNASERPKTRTRWFIYILVGGASAATIGPYLMLVLLGCGLLEIVIRREGQVPSPPARTVVGPLAAPAVAVGGFGALA